MLELHTLLTTKEWESIVEETIHYKCFIECLKEVAIPSLAEHGEKWEEEDDWFRVQLDVAVSRIRNIDQLLVASYKQEEIKEVYSKKMKEGAEATKVMIAEIRKEQRAMIDKQIDWEKTVDVTEL